ncbi:MAG: endonuclease/exonuclease/phosphatase family protein [Acidimicrobiales bacterium]
MAALQAELSDVGADLVILQEVTPEHAASLESAAALAGLGHRWVTASDGHRGMGIWSRFELDRCGTVDAGGEPQLRTVLRLPGGGELGVYGVHVPAPLPGRLRCWTRALRSLQAEAARSLQESGRPLVMAGDFNTPAYLPHFRDLLRRGLDDAAAGHPAARRMTWPNHPWLPALFRLDHVLVSPGLLVDSYRVGRGSGSDHRPVVVDLVVLPGTVAEGVTSSQRVPRHPTWRRRVPA